MPTSHSRCTECRTRIAGYGMCDSCKKQRYKQRTSVYKSKEWREWWRPLVLTEELVCRMCHLPGPTEVDHILPLRERPDLAYIRSNLQALHKWCHSEKTRSEQ